MWIIDIQPIRRKKSLCLSLDHFDSQYKGLPVVLPNLIQFYSQNTDKFKEVNTYSRHCRSSIKPLHLGYTQYTTFISHLRTHFSIVVLRLCVEQTADPLHTAELYFHISQVTHHPVQVVRYLLYQVQNHVLEFAENYVRVLFNVCWAGSFTMRAYVRPRPTSPAESSLLIEATAAISTTNAPMYS